MRFAGRSNTDQIQLRSFKMSHDLPKTMAAVICHSPEDYRLEEHAVPAPDAGEVIIRVNSVGICASDLKCYLGAPLF